MLQLQDTKLDIPKYINLLKYQGSKRKKARNNTER